MSLCGLFTATIGSFPLDDSEKNRSRILDDLIKLDLDFPNYPQLIEMGKQFLDDIDRGVSPIGLEPFNWTVKYIKKKRMEDKIRLKACLTGPFTLAFYVKKANSTNTFSIFNTALADKEKVEEFTDMLSKTCQAYGKTAKMIFIDEPMLSLIVGKRIILGYTQNDIITIYNKLRDACGDTYVGTHVCGKISPLLAQTLLTTDLDILSHEYYGTPHNFDVYSKRDLDASDKMLAVGCLSAKDENVESVNHIKSIMEKSTKKYGNNMIFTPDDGFGNLIVKGSKEIGYRIAIRKLKNMKKAIHKIK